MSTPGIPPQNIEAEESLLGSLLVTDGAMMERIQHLSIKGDDFYLEKHALIYEAIESLLANGNPSGEIAVSQYLRDKAELDRAGGEHYPAQLAAKVPATGNAPHYAEIVKQCSRRRGLISSSQKLQEAAYDPSVGLDDALTHAQETIIDDGGGHRRGAGRLIRHGVADVIDRQDELANTGGVGSGARSGFAPIDELLHDLRPGTMTVIAARPSLGKSALAGNIVENICLDQQLPTLFQSLEMSEEELIERMLSSQAHVPLSAFRRGKVSRSSWPRIMQACNRFEKAPLYIDDSGGLTATEISMRARSLHRRLEPQGGLSLMLVDYLQLIRISNSRQTEFEKVTDASIALKALAKDLNVPVIAVSQLSRAPDMRPDHRPQLSDLRQSGQIEQDADVVLFIYREDHYDRDSEPTGLAEIIIAKNRNGPVGQCELHFVDRYASFREEL